MRAGNDLIALITDVNLCSLSPAHLLIKRKTATWTSPHNYDIVNFGSAIKITMACNRNVQNHNDGCFGLNKLVSVENREEGGEKSINDLIRQQREE